TRARDFRYSPRCEQPTSNRSPRAVHDNEEWRKNMRYAVTTSAALFLWASPAPPALAQSPGDLVKEAVAAQGGAEALRAFKSAVVKGEAKHWEPGQSLKADGEARFLGDSTFTLTADGVNRVARVDWDRDMKYPAADRLKYSEIVTPTYGVVIDGKGAQLPMSGIRLASHMRELVRM